MFTEKQPVQLIEGVYSLHPSLRGGYDLCVMLDINSALQRQRIQARNPDKLERFLNEWIPLENNYFEACDIAGRCGIVHRL